MFEDIRHTSPRQTTIFLGKTSKVPKSIWNWLRRHLFASVTDACLTMACVALLYVTLPSLYQWTIAEATFIGDSRDDCTGGGACWVFIKARFLQFLYGFYPLDQLWRVNLSFSLFAVLSGPLFFKGFRYKLPLTLFLLFLFPVLAWQVLEGGVLGLSIVETSQWGGLMLTLIVAGVGIVASLPLGVVLALCRRSSMRIVAKLAVVFIEVWRGVPLITVLFMASVMLPLFLPEGVTFDKLLRALVGVILFSAAYMAEVVRGGLQAIPRGQFEAAEALGLGYTRMMALVILPQALKKVIPGIVNTFIGLFKDTTLVLIIGMFDLLGIVQAAATDPQWLGYAVEGYVFAGVVFWVFCFTMSRVSLRIERRLATEP